jgi:hypothetical protein
MAYVLTNETPRGIDMVCDHCGAAIADADAAVASLDALTLESLSDQWGGEQLEHVCPECQSDAGLMPNYID